MSEMTNEAAYIRDDWEYALTGRALRQIKAEVWDEAHGIGYSKGQEDARRSQPSPRTVSKLTPQRLQFARELADPDWSLSVPEQAKAVIRDLIAALTDQEAD